jgi:hypothetical protein
MYTGCNAKQRLQGLGSAQGHNNRVTKQLGSICNVFLAYFPYFEKIK